MRKQLRRGWQFLTGDICQPNSQHSWSLRCRLQSQMRKTDSKSRRSVPGVGAGTHGSDSVAAEVTVSDPRTKIQQNTKKWAHLASSKQSPQVCSRNTATNNVGRRFQEKKTASTVTSPYCFHRFRGAAKWRHHASGGTGRGKYARSKEGVALTNRDGSYWLGAGPCCSHVSSSFARMDAWEGHVTSAWPQKQDFKVAL